MKYVLDTDNLQHHGVLKVLLNTLAEPEAFELRQEMEAARTLAQGRFYATAQCGHMCRAKCSAPAKYIGRGKCLFISAMDNDLCVDDAVPPIGNESSFPLPPHTVMMKAASLLHILVDDGDERAFMHMLGY